MAESGLLAEVQNFGGNELNIVDGNGHSDNPSTAPKSKNRVQIVTSNTKSEDKRPKSDATIRMRGNVLIQNPAQEWKVRSCELNGSFLTFFRKQKMVAAIDLEQVGDINVLRKINDSAGQGFIFSLHLKEGRYFNVRVTMYDDALNWVKVLIETRDKLRSHHSHHSRTRSFSGHNETNYSSFTPLASDFNTSLLVADEPDDNIKVYFDNGQYPPSPIFEANEKYVRPLQTKSSLENLASSQNSVSSPHSTASSHRGSIVSPGKGDAVPTTPVLQPRALNDGQEGGFGRGEADAEEVVRGDSADDETVQPYDSNSFDEEEQRRAEAERAMRAKLAEMEAERLAEEQAEEARLGAMIASARSARENAEKAAQAKAAREEKMREEQAARAAKIATDKAAEEKHLATERAAKEARFAAEQGIREKKAAAEKLVREKEAAEKAAEDEKIAAERALRVSEREAAAKKKLAEQAMAAKEAEKAEKQMAQDSVERKANLRAFQQAERKGSFIAAPSSPARANPTTPSSAPTSAQKETPAPLSLAGSLFGQVDDMKFSQENMWRLSRSFEHAKPGYLQPELNLDGIDVTVVDSPQSSRSADSRKQLAAHSAHSAHIVPASPSLLKAATTANAQHGSAAKTAELTVANVSQHTSSASSPPRVTSENSSPAKTSPLPSSFDEVFDSAPVGSASPKFRSTFNPNTRKGAATPERKRSNSGTTRPSSLMFQACVGVVFVVVVLLGALGSANYYRRYQAQEMWRAESLKNLATNPIARTASDISRSSSIGSTGLSAASKSNTASQMPSTDRSLSKTAGSANQSPAGLSTKPALSSGASTKSPASAENPHAVARNSNAIRKFFATLFRAPARLLAGVFSKLVSLFK